MKKKDFLNLKDKTTKELEDLIREKGLEITKFKTELYVSKHKNVHVAKTARRDLAQMKTVLRQKEIVDKMGAQT